MYVQHSIKYFTALYFYFFRFSGAGVMEETETGKAVTLGMSVCSSSSSEQNDSNCEVLNFGGRVHAILIQSAFRAC